jgi:hypothetical protein
MSFIKKHPIASIGLLIGLIIFFFFPFLFFVILAGLVFYESLIKTEDKEPINKKHFTPLSSKKLDPRKWSYNQKQEYLKSPEWNRISGLTKLRALYKCEHCKSTRDLQTHHITYERLGREDINDLACLCSSCHSKIHKRLGYSQFSTYPISTLKE